MSRKVPKGWRLAPFNDIASDVSIRNRRRDQIPVLSVTKYDGFVPSEEYFQKKVFSVDTENYKIVRKGQFAYATIHLDEGSIDRLTRFEAGLISPMYTVFQIDETQADPEFILRLFKFYATNGRFDALGNGGVNRRKSISFSALGKLSIPLPPLHEQRRIAEILSSVDEAITESRAVIAQIRKVKQGVLGRLLTRGIGHTRFKQTEIGEIPEGWDAANLFDVLREPLRNGYSPVSPSSPTGGWLLSLGSLSDDGLTGENLKPAPLDDPRIVAAKLSYGDVLISRSNTPDRVGMVGIYKGQPHNCFFPDLMICLRFSEDIINADFGALWLRHLQASGYFKRAAAGTSASMVKINRRILSQIRIAVPSIGEQVAVVNRMSELQLTIGAAEDQLRAAVSMKAALMSDLLTGRKRVTDALPMAAE